MTVKTALIVARSRNGVIGREGGLPWRLSADMKHFKTTTLGKPCLMGRKTWESLPVKPLPGRPCLVLTRDNKYHSEDADIFTGFDPMMVHAEALAQQGGVDEVMVIGGAELYALALPKAHRLYLTEIEAEIDGDVYFPDFDEAQWVELSRREVKAGPKDDFDIVLRVLERRA